MAFTFDPSLANEISQVRFHIGDTREEAHFLEDETLQYLISQHGWKLAVLHGIRSIILNLSRPDIRLDWMTISMAEARKGYERMLQEKSQELGVSISGARMYSSVSLPSRADGGGPVEADQKQTPDL